MGDTITIKIFLSSFAMQLPTLIVSLIALVVILIKRQQASRAAPWALLGFGLTLILCLLVPLFNALTQHWIYTHGGVNILKTHGGLFSAFSIFCSIIHAFTYGCLLIAIFYGRSQSESSLSPASSRQ
jgi:hypothetical protein